jgi:Putative sensor
MNPFDRRLWASAWYLLAYLGVSGLGFAVAFTAATTAATLGWTLVGLPLMVAAAAAIRGCANVERARTGAFLGEPLGARYREATQPGVISQVRTRWKDSATWRDVAYLVGMFVPLLVLDTIVLAVWLVLLAGITLPIWYRFPEQTFGHGQSAHGVQVGYFPNGPHASPGYGFYIDSLPRALIAAAVCLVLFLLFSRVLVLTARAHALVARALLRAAADPLAHAREVLSRPGPLTSLWPNGQVLHVPAREGPAHGREPGNDHSHPPLRKATNATVAEFSIAGNH